MTQDQALVLRATRWQDSHLIIRLFGKQNGIVDSIAYGAKSSKSSSKAIYFQPLNLLDVVLTRSKRSNGLLYIQEAHFSALSGQATTFQPVKYLYKQFLAEVLVKSIQEELPNVLLFQLIHDFISRFDELQQHLYTACIWFLWQFAKVMGIEPDEEWKKETLSQLLFGLNLDLLSKQRCSEYLESLATPYTHWTSNNPLQGEQRFLLIKKLAEHVLSQLGASTELKTLEMFQQVMG